MWATHRNARQQNSINATSDMINQLQENHENDRKAWHQEKEWLKASWNEEKASLENRQNRLENRLERAESVTRLLTDYVSQLRHHIDAGNPPPPPPYPKDWPK